MTSPPGAPAVGFPADGSPGRVPAGGGCLTGEDGTPAIPASSLSHRRGRSAGESALGFTAGNRRFLRILLLVFLLVFCVQWILAVRTRPEPMAIERGAGFQKLFTVDVNRATWIEWIQLDGIGPALAHRLEADRQVNGPFRSLDELTRVPGIGQVTLDRIRPWLEISDAPEGVAESPTE